MARVTSRDVARAAGVSQSTVSFVLNGRRLDKISAATREHVLATARELDYVPSASARNLRSGRSEVVLVVLADLAVNQATEEFKAELGAALAQAGLACVYLHPPPPQGGGIDGVWANVQPALVLAFDLLPEPARGAVTRAGLPVIDDLFGPNSGGLTGLDQGDIGRMQVRYLLERGHRRLGFATTADPRETRFARPRLEGVAQECAARGVPRPLLLDPEEPDALAGLRSQGVTGVAAYNDIVAIAMIAACRSARLAVPDDLAVIGVDDIRVAALVDPRLTTVRLTTAPLARRLARRVLEELGKPPDVLDGFEDEQVLTLVVRDSA